MREEPTLRIPLGILALLAALIIYGAIVATFVPPLIDGLPTLLQTVVYLVLGIVWLLPLRRFLIWMETGRWSAPPEQ
ncbi:DUF2842 domain-containing protein [Qipengyuania spongiae]|uniref:DUF2842 domain-containing protein n=1 Tax=Qipengyuania spongiae TaxID=2909673 RepID=A0ABY5SWX9_9SPHN|nr:DUF2842 domain-containing protein [Qipengyuania spongiae]UVI39038.1 DUF2842 domain-containing protein [Qipengyuania spongiae]